MARAPLLQISDIALTFGGDPVFADLSLDPAALTPDEFDEWRAFFQSLMRTTMEISKVCSGLLSNNRLTEEGTELVDSRGHPIVNEKQPEAKNADYENLILVGIWLAVKENGETQQNLLKWAQLPQSDDDKASLL